MNACLWELFTRHPYAVQIGFVLCAGFVGHFPVVWFLRATGFYRAQDSNLPNFALWVGVLERLAVAALVTLDALTASAFIFAAKTGVMAVRFRDEERRQDIVEYVLVGTLASFLVAVAFGLGARGMVRLAPK